MHRIRKHAQEGRHPETREKLVAYCFSCSTCNVFRHFTSRAMRDREAKAHEQQPIKVSQ